MKINVYWLYDSILSYEKLAPDSVGRFETTLSFTYMFPENINKFCPPSFLFKSYVLGVSN